MRKIILIFSVLFSGSIFAQQQPTFTQFFVNDMSLNPAISGSKTYNPLTILTRQQWLGFEGAPLTSNISYHGALNNRSAMGGFLMFDKTSPALSASFQINYAYHVPLNYDRVNLSFGAGAKVMYHNLDFKPEDLPPGVDPAFSSNSYEKYLGDAATGVYLYGENFYLGFSALNLLESSFNNAVTGSPTPNTEFRNFYGMGAYRFYIVNKDWQLEPSFLIRKMDYQKAVIDLSSRIFYLRNTWAGLTYRTDGNLGVGFGFASNRIHFSYTYDHSFSGDIMKYNYGTHEIGISFRIESLATQRHIGFWRH